MNTINRNYPLLEGGGGNNVSTDLAATRAAFQAIDGDVQLLFNEAAGIDAKVAAGVGLDLVRYLTMPGPMVIFTGKARWYPSKNITLKSIFLCLDTPATGSGVQIVLRKNNAIVATVDIDAGEFKSPQQALVDINATPADYFTIDVVSIGSTIPGSDLTITINYTY